MIDRQVPEMDRDGGVGAGRNQFGLTERHLVAMGVVKASDSVHECGRAR